MASMEAEDSIMTDDGSGHVANYEFTSGLPEPPKLLWEIPAMPGDPVTDNSRNNLFANSNVRDAELSGFKNVSFLRKVTYNNFTSKSQSQDDRADGARSVHSHTYETWDYNSRRDAQAVLPFIYLGPASIAKNSRFLLDEKITMVLLVRDLSQEVSVLLTPRTAQNLGIETHILEVRPNKIVSMFPRAINLINKHLSERFAQQERDNEERTNLRQTPDTSLPGRVLIYDLTGNEAAAAMVAAYIVAMFSTKAGQAVFAVQSKRFCVHTQVIHESVALYHSMIKARREVNLASRRDSEFFRASQHPKNDEEEGEGEVTVAPILSSSRGKKRGIDLSDTLTALADFSMQANPEQEQEQEQEQDNTNEHLGGMRHVDPPFSDRHETVSSMGVGQDQNDGE